MVFVVLFSCSISTLSLLKLIDGKNNYLPPLLDCDSLKGNDCLNIFLSTNTIHGTSSGAHSVAG